MVLSSLVVVLFAVEPASIRLAAPGLTGVNVKPEVATFWTEHLAQQLTLRGPRVMTASEFSALLGMERQRQLLGCAEASNSCMAELAGALGADGVVTGSVGHFGDQFQVNLKVIGSRNGKILGLFSGAVSDEAAVMQLLTRAAEELSRQVISSLAPGNPPAVAVAEPSRPPSKRWFATIPGVIALGAFAFGAYEFSSASSSATALRTAAPGVTLTDARGLYDAGVRSQGLGIAASVVGGVLTVATGVLFWLLGDRPTPVAVTGPELFTLLAAGVP